MDHQRIRERAHALWQAAGHPHGRHDEFWLQAERELHGDEAHRDSSLADTFPASDPPASSGITGTSAGDEPLGSIAERTTASETVADPGGTRPAPASANAAAARQTVRSGDRNELPRG